MNAFTTARWRLTLWYMVISFGLLTMFTIAAVLAENQAFMAVRELVHSQVRGIVFNAVLQAEINNFEQQFIQRLIIFDLLMLVVAGLASYILSGRTLAPIEAMVKEQDAFAADASHELRTPLANIAMEIEARRRSKSSMSKEDASLLDSIQTEVSRMSGIVAGLLSFVRVNEVVAIKPAAVNISQMATEVLEGMQARLEEKRLVVKQNIEPEIMVLHQPDALRQLLLILLDNATLYTPRKGDINITVQRKGDSAELKLHNSGPGIEQRELPLLFKRFYRGNVKEPGTGLGLAIAQSIVERYGGSIGVASSTGQGVTFRVLLPIV